MKKLRVFVAFIVMVLCLSACHSSMSLTYSVETGDVVMVELDTTKNDYKLHNVDNGFEIKLSGEVVATGKFATAEQMQRNVELVTASSDMIEIPDAFKANGVEPNGNPLYYEYDGTSQLLYNFEGVGVVLTVTDANVVSKLSIELK